MKLIFFSVLKEQKKMETPGGSQKGYSFESETFTILIKKKGKNREKHNQNYKHLDK